MIRKLAKAGAIYRACRININKNKKVKKLAQAMEYGAIGTLATVHTGYLLRQPVVEQFIRTTQKSDAAISHLSVPNKAALSYFVARTRYFTNDSIQRLNGYVRPMYTGTIPSVEQTEKMLQKRVIFKIMEDDKALPANLDKDKLASTILNVSSELGVDPIAIACIIQHESDFVTGLNRKGAKGLMQVTSITVKDMYQKGREHLYHSALNELKKDHPSSASLYNAILGQDSINIKVGSMSYLMRLQQAKGNVKTALKNYNGSSLKEQYANDVLKNIQKYSAEYSKLKEELTKTHI